MAAGDVVSVIHNAGSGTTFSYTSAIDIAITNVMCADRDWETIL